MATSSMPELSTVAGPTPATPQAVHSDNDVKPSTSSAVPPTSSGVIIKSDENCASLGGSSSSASAAPSLTPTTPAVCAFAPISKAPPLLPPAHQFSHRLGRADSFEAWNTELRAHLSAHDALYFIDNPNNEPYRADTPELTYAGDVPGGFRTFGKQLGTAPAPKGKAMVLGTSSSLSHQSMEATPHWQLVTPAETTHWQAWVKAEVRVRQILLSSINHPQVHTLQWSKLQHMWSAHAIYKRCVARYGPMTNPRQRRSLVLQDMKNMHLAAPATAEELRAHMRAFSSLAQEAREADKAGALSLVTDAYILQRFEETLSSNLARFVNRRIRRWNLSCPLGQCVPFHCDRCDVETYNCDSTLYRPSVGRITPREWFRQYWAVWLQKKSPWEDYQHVYQQCSDTTGIPSHIMIKLRGKLKIDATLPPSRSMIAHLVCFADAMKELDAYARGLGKHSDAVISKLGGPGGDYAEYIRATTTLMDEAAEISVFLQTLANVSDPIVAAAHAHLSRRQSPSWIVFGVRFKEAMDMADAQRDRLARFHSLAHKGVNGKVEMTKSRSPCTESAKAVTSLQRQEPDSAVRIESTPNAVGASMRCEPSTPPSSENQPPVRAPLPALIGATTAESITTPAARETKPTSAPPSVLGPPAQIPVTSLVNATMVAPQPNPIARAAAMTAMVAQAVTRQEPSGTLPVTTALTTEAVAPSPSYTTVTSKTSMLALSSPTPANAGPSGRPDRIVLRIPARPSHKESSLKPISPDVQQPVSQPLVESSPSTPPSAVSPTKPLPPGTASAHLSNLQDQERGGLEVIAHRALPGLQTIQDGDDVAVEDALGCLVDNSHEPAKEIVEVERIGDAEMAVEDRPCDVEEHPDYGPLGGQADGGQAAAATTNESIASWPNARVLDTTPEALRQHCRASFVERYCRNVPHDMRTENRIVSSYLTALRYDANEDVQHVVEPVYSRWCEAARVGSRGLVLFEQLFNDMLRGLGGVENLGRVAKLCEVYETETIPAPAPPAERVTSLDVVVKEEPIEFDPPTSNPAPRVHVTNASDSDDDFPSPRKRRVALPSPESKTGRRLRRRKWEPTTSEENVAGLPTKRQRRLPTSSDEEETGCGRLTRRLVNKLTRSWPS